MSDPVEPSECELCEGIYGNSSDKVIDCDRCRGHFCAKCLRMPDAAYQYMCQPAKIWCCTDSSKFVKKLINEDQESENNNSNKKSREDLNKMMKNMNTMIMEMCK